MALCTLHPNLEGVAGPSAPSISPGQGKLPGAPSPSNTAAGTREGVGGGGQGLLAAHLGSLQDRWEDS